MNRWTHGLIWGVLSSVCCCFPGLAAERVYLSFLSANISVSVQSLEDYVDQNVVSPELESYLLLLSAEDQAQFRTVLQDALKVDPLIVSQFLYSPTGEIFLQKLGDLIQAQSSQSDRPTLQNGSNAVRIALIEAAQNPEGISLLRVLKQFPSEGIQLNTQLLFELRDQVELLMKETDSVVAEIVKLSSQEVNQSIPFDFAQQPDLRQSRNDKVAKRSWFLRDQRRNRSIPVDFYFPERLDSGIRQSPNTVPVIVVSHGLGADRNSYASFGQHLASYGFAVALIQHPGSDSYHIQTWLSGKASDVFDVNEFIDRPLDVSYLLDELEHRNRVEFQSQLNLNQVGVAGYSFGAYTALALGGAELNFANLETQCASKLDSLNLAQIFQCRALELPRQPYRLRDSRVKAIMPMNPLSGSIFGQESLSRIQIPILWKTSGEDNVTPVAREQVRSFTWLTTPYRYLLLAEGDHHINLNLNVVNRTISASLQEIIAPTPTTVNGYVNAMGLAFFKVHVMNEMGYQPYLQASYARTISKEPYP
ncbi:MAG: alpha/beta hydrolase [Oscillatoriales cyanobacterium SM2_3_0]|nr:alpha/beta hydrolase [Oscillatoriales cyanobacterium SM2_3_0]